MHCTVMNIFFLIFVALKVNAMPQTFCGDRLTKMMSQYCLSYNTPAHRIRREIVKECCQNPCSLEYMLSYYCASFNRDALKNYMNEIKNIKRDMEAKNKMNDNDHHPKDPFSQVRKTNSSRNLGMSHVHLIHPQWQISCELESHNRNPRKTDMSHNKSKNSNGKNNVKEIEFTKNTAREPKLGQIEDSQRPFYVFKRYKR